MKITRITDVKDTQYSAFRRLYEQSFPIFEQRDDMQQAKAFDCADYHLDVYHERDDMVGFLAYWEFDNYLYIEHFAIHTRLRGQGYGQKLLPEFIGQNAKYVILEIDPVCDEVTAARLRFYQKCGFCENPYSHVHPPYIEGRAGHRLSVLTSGRVISNEEYLRFGNDLDTIVMSRYL